MAWMVDRYDPVVQLAGRWVFLTGRATAAQRYSEKNKILGPGSRALPGPVLMLDCMPVALD